VPPVGQVTDVVSVSAVTGEGVETLLAAIEACLAQKSTTFHLSLPHSAGPDVGWLYAHAEIIGRDQADESGTGMLVRVDPRHKSAFMRKFGDRLIRE
jgi:GTP-binding protein HflX